MCLCVCTHTCVFMWKPEDNFRCCFPSAVCLVDLEVTVGKAGRPGSLMHQPVSTCTKAISICATMHPLLGKSSGDWIRLFCAPKASTLSNESPLQPLLFKFLEPPFWWNQITDIISQRNYKIKRDQRDFYSYFNGTMRGMRRAVGWVRVIWVGLWSIFHF